MEKEYFLFLGNDAQSLKEIRSSTGLRSLPLIYFPDKMIVISARHQICALCHTHQRCHNTVHSCNISYLRPSSNSHKAVKLVVLCPRFPYPLEKGDKLRIFHQLRLLKEHFQICLIAIVREEPDPTYLSVVEDLVQECHCVQISHSARQWSAAKALVTGMPLQVGYYYSKSAQKQVDKIISEYAPDHIYCQLIRMAPYVSKYSIPKTIDYMDAFGVGMERRAQVSTGWQRWLYTIDAGRTKRYEAAIYKDFQAHTIISAQDRQHIGDGSLPITINPNGIDTAFFAPMESEIDHDIAFVGNMGYLPNVQAAEYLIKELEVANKYKVILAGARPDKRVKLLQRPNVTITGWVDDVRKSYARSKIFVAPLWSGTGQQNKILEAMAMGVPCITTATVNRAIGAEDEEEILVAEDKRQFTAAIQRLLTDQELYQKLKINGRKFVKEAYSWQSNAEVLSKIFTP